MFRSSLILAVVASFGLAACGDTTAEQAVLGGAVGAGVASVTNSSVAAGAAIGAGANVLYCKNNPGSC